jgi:prepilin-type N-terminal cleavage/methylation domain-containing protein
MKNIYEKAFTLVELIVVIAIIAILGAALIPSFSRYIDDGRFSNDVSKAASMTSVIRAYNIENNDVIGAYDVIEIINGHHGDEFDWTPSAKNTGFFYLSGSKRIIALRYDDALEFEDAQSLRTQLTSNLDLSDDIVSPAEIMGNGKHLLTRDGSPIALAVRFIDQLAKSGGRLELSYSEGLEVFETYHSETILNRILTFFQGDISDHVRDRIESYIDHYDPDTTLYVNNLGWFTTGTTNDVINKIVFADGISNIPPYDYTGDASVSIDTISLPRTVRSVEDGGFNNQVFENVSVTFASNQTIAMNREQAFHPSMTFEVSSNVLVNMEIPGSEGVITYSVVDGDLSLSLSGLTDFLQTRGLVLNSYRIDMDYGDLYREDDFQSKVYVYTVEGYYGYIVPLPALNE